MRFRTSAALTLVMTLLASSLSTLTCGFECLPSPMEATVSHAVAVTAAPGSCHRGIEQDPASAFALSAVPHDCATHAPLIPRLIQPNASASLLKAKSSMPVLTSSHVNAGLSVPPAAILAVRDLAPPGRTPGLIAPLRI